MSTFDYNARELLSKLKLLIKCFITDAMDGNLESGEVNPERSQLCYVIDDLSAQNAPNGSTVDHTVLYFPLYKCLPIHVSLLPVFSHLCASILLACIFCQPWDCLLATGKGCHACASSLCSSLCTTVCCCEPDSLEPLLDMTHHCGCCGCMDAHCCLCVDPGFECCVCDICIQATECVDLGMEISQMLFH
ncbi:unnamed protein product [Coregonus sp. 'balchen']|nr:unnamed protein product [Coregonus sp. 'balchen']